MILMDKWFRDGVVGIIVLSPAPVADWHNANMSPRADFAADMRELTEFRHDLHRHPELGYQETRTTARIAAELTALGVEHRAGIARGTGVVAYLPATVPGGRCIGLRADIDALPIQEETGLPYASESPGRMHACGHDGHTTILLGTIASLVAEPERPNDLVFVFQPAEEGGAGGLAMVEAGALRGEVVGPPVDLMFGLHCMPHQLLGTVSTRVGPLMASAAGFKVHIRGKGTHAAYPHGGIDPIVAGSHIVTALQTVASRSVSPLDSVVVTIGQFVAGVAHNVIPETAMLNGTLRTLNDATAAIARERIETIVGHAAAALGASAHVEWSPNPYPVVVNDPGATEIFRRAAREEFGADAVLEEPEPSMGGEDFSYYGREVPACFYFLGMHESGTEEIANLHHPRFDFNDRAIPVGIRAMRAVAFFR